MTDGGLDYDADPGRFSLVEAVGLAGDSHSTVASRILAAGASPVLDIGCGRGRLALALGGAVSWVGLDSSPAQIAACDAKPVVVGDARTLPFADGSFAAVAALWMLYHFDQPTQVVAEADRVLQPGGLFLACTDSRADAGELVAPRSPTSFDAEEAPAVVRAVFEDVAVQPWQTRIDLLIEDDVTAFLRGMAIPESLRKPVKPPLTVTKHGCIITATKR